MIFTAIKTLNKICRMRHQKDDTGREEDDWRAMSVRHAFRLSAEELDVDELEVSSIFVDEGMTMKRLRPRAKGRADRILKRSCHVTVKVADSDR